MKEVLMQHQTNILAGSPTPPDSPNYDDWLGAPEFNEMQELLFGN